MLDDPLDNPNLAIRREHDRCFHAVEEVVPGGYIVEGIFIDEDDVAEVRKTGSEADGGQEGGDSSTWPACRK